MSDQALAVLFADLESDHVERKRSEKQRDPRRWLPDAYVQFLRIDGTELTDPIRDQKELSGTLHEVLSRLDELPEINISTATDHHGWAA